MVQIILINRGVSGDVEIGIVCAGDDFFAQQIDVRRVPNTVFVEITWDTTDGFAGPSFEFSAASGDPRRALISTVYPLAGGVRNGHAGPSP